VRRPPHPRSRGASFIHLSPPGRGESDLILATHFSAPEFCHPRSRSDEAIGSERLKPFRLRNASYRLAPGKLKEAERRQTHLSRCPHASGVRCALRRRRLAPPSACGRARLPAFHLRFSPKGLSSRGLSFGPGFPKTAPNAADWPPTPPRSQRCTSRAGLSAGRRDARAARERIVSFRPRAPHSLRRRGVPSQMASFNERDRPPLLSSILASQRR
jgi:hypothetical protein